MALIVYSASSHHQPPREKTWCKRPPELFRLSSLQYWYSEDTIDAVVREIENWTATGERPVKIAFLSTPSIYFSVNAATQEHSVLFDVRISRSRSRIV